MVHSIPDRSEMGSLLSRGRLAIAACIVIALGIAGVATLTASERTVEPAHPMLHVLNAVRAAPMRIDTLYLGGYAAGSFHEALQAIASELTVAERTLVGRHLDGIFSNVLLGEEMERGGRLRLAYERAVRPDGSTRSIRVLAAEAAVAGRMHTAYFFEHEGQPGYFDGFGRSLDSRGWVRPLGDARITSRFNSRRMHPILEQVLPHLGTDYAAPHGTPVRATGDGTVTVAEWRGGYGNLVELQHANGYTTRYAHLSRFGTEARRGMYVRQGDVIGFVGATGLATGPHLHYEVRRHGRPVDPEVALSEAGIASELPFSADWSATRQELGALLARAPRTVASRSDPPAR
jgi:murein DD-endopeptidase MepM/ murein hydrolase activator NlpD